MIYWIDAQLPPQLANWLQQTFQVEAYALRDLHLRDAEDEEIFRQARQQGIVIITCRVRTAHHLRCQALMGHVFKRGC